MTRKERKARRDNVINNTINYVINNGGTVRINDLYDLIGNGVFNSQQYFMRCVIDTFKNDIRFKIQSARKIGTFVCVSDQELVIPKTKKQIKADQPKRPVGRPRKNIVETRKVTMKLLFGKNRFDFTGFPTQVQITDEWKKCKSVPKMFSHYTDTKEVHRKDNVNGPSHYIQICTDGKRFIYKAV